jgi:hypothetical protein
MSGESAVGRCYRCGNPTSSPDVGLCDECNPSGIAGPTATQVHGLILACVAGALILMAVAAKAFGSAGGPFPASIVGQASYPDGSVGVVVRIANEGTATGRPTCTITRGPQDSGVEFLADPVAAGTSIVVTKHVPELPAGSPPGDVRVDCR